MKPRALVRFPTLVRGASDGVGDHYPRGQAPEGL